MSRTLKICLLAASCTGASVSLPAVAQTVSEEIVVTARKREESVQDVPIAISVIGAQQIKDMKLANVDDIAGILPNVVNSGGGQGGDTFAIRGLSTTSNNPGFETGIGMYIDEVYIGRQFAFVTPIFDLQRIEVLRGPQGTLFGRNTIGGAISLTTLAPSDTFEASAQVSAGEYDLIEGGFRLSGPIGGNGFRASLSAQIRERDGFLKDFATGADYNGQSSINTRASFVFEPSDTVRIRAAVDYYEDDNADSMMDIRGGALAAADPYPVSKRRIGTNFKSFGSRESLGGMVRLDADLGWTNLVSISALRRHETRGLLDQDFSVADISFTGRTEKQEQFSQEIRLQSPASASFTYVVGAYYFHEELDSITTANLGADVLGSPETAFTTADVNSDSWALFGNVEVDLSERLAIGGGLRYTAENKDLDFAQTLSPGAFLLPLLGIAIEVPALRNSTDEGEWSGNAYINYKPTEDILAYASYSRGYKAGGFNATVIGTTPSDLSFAAEFVDSYEIGLKTSWMNDRVRLNIAAFHIDYADKQEQSLVGTTFIVNNAASADSDGFEIELFAAPTDHLTIMGGIGYTDAKYGTYLGCSVDGEGDPVACSGNRLQNAPRWTASLAGRYEQPISDNLTGFLGGDISYRDGAYVSSLNNPNYLHEKRTIVNAQIGIEGAEGRWRLTFWGKNIFDNDASELSFDFLGTDYTMLVAPRTLGVELGFSF